MATDRTTMYRRVYSAGCKSISFACCQQRTNCLPCLQSFSPRPSGIFLVFLCVSRFVHRFYVVEYFFLILFRVVLALSDSFCDIRANWQWFKKKDKPRYNMYDGQRMMRMICFARAELSNSRFANGSGKTCPNVRTQHCQKCRVALRLTRCVLMLWNNHSVCEAALPVVPLSEQEIAS